MNTDNTLLSTLGIEIIYASKDQVEATMPVDERTKQPFGLLHGGASVALAETVASLGGFLSIDQEKEICVGLEINANHIKGKRDGLVTAIGRPIHKGKKTAIWEVKITDEKNELICISRCTLAILPKK
ncbi:esterase [Priestia aryabhattai]|uniref:hotdog fold thioesterase n=1 Tax=Bacillaceae TaxID=186817 RepID=UPI000BA19101|nr:MULTISPECIES: hotdog fold thioesterase [Bacillaceae]MDT2045054.1 hotdog fold thioesterase [Priestia flexa]OZT13160.1 esterase [Priestia aryabhattai]TDB51738.1 hotdog fold thioesterase [Bacillus sp. CBEL-1]USY54858.1 hotdog fold thioesterase [Bacillus sp. 1780r2a1]